VVIARQVVVKVAHDFAHAAFYFENGGAAHRSATWTRCHPAGWRLAGAAAPLFSEPPCQTRHFCPCWWLTRTNYTNGTWP
jgi:hypothetical protein